MQLVDLRIFTEPQQGATYDDLLAIAQRAEALGFGAFFRSDHFLRIGEGSGDPGPTDAWLTLAAIGRETATIRLGTLVSSATFRMPGPLAIAVATADQMSGGRVEFGLGAGWFEAEHTAYGIPFPDVTARFDNLEEQLAIISGLWNTPVGETFSYSGERWQITDSPALPKPVQAGGPPIIVGGSGKVRTPQLAARHAAEFNTSGADLETFAEQRHRVIDACTAIDRDPATMTFSAVVAVCCGSNEAEVDRRAAALGRNADDLRQNGAAGTPEEVADRIRAQAAVGVERIYLQVFDLADLDHLNLIAEEVGPLLQ